MTGFDDFMRAYGYSGSGTDWKTARMGIPISQQKVEEMMLLYKKTRRLKI